MGFSVIKPALEHLIFWENMKTTDPLFHSALSLPTFQLFPGLCCVTQNISQEASSSNMHASCIFCLLALTKEAHKTYEIFSQLEAQDTKIYYP